MTNAIIKWQKTEENFRFENWEISSEKIGRFKIESPRQGKITYFPQPKIEL